MSLNYKAFNSGVWHEEKKEMLAYFKRMLPGGSRNQYFRHYASLWACDLSNVQAPSTDNDYEELWASLDEIESFTRKLDNPKTARWFSINTCCEGNFPEFWPLKMVLSYYQTGCDDVPTDTFTDPDRAIQNPREELNLLRANLNGFKLADKLLSHWLHASIKVFYWCTIATWKFYISQCKHGRPPAQNLARMWQWARGGWERTELRDMIETAFENPKALKDMGLDWRAPRLQVDRQQLMASTTVEFTFALASNRCWSMLVYKFAPFSYSGILVAGDENKEAGMNAMKDDVAIRDRLSQTWYLLWPRSSRTQKT